MSPGGEATITPTATPTTWRQQAGTPTPRVGRPGRGVTALILAAGLAAGAVEIYLAAAAGMSDAPLRAALAWWTSVPYVVAGAIAWRLRPDSRLGLWMIAAGFGTAAAFLNWSDNDLLFTIGTATQFLPPLLFLIVFLTYPTGRATSTAPRIVIGIAALAAALTLVYMPLGYEGSRSVLALADSTQFAEALQNLQLALMILALVAGTVLLVGRRIRQGRPLRPWLGYLVDSFSLTLLLLACLYLAALTGWAVVTDPLRLATFALIGVAPIVFLFGLLQERLGRASVADLVAFSEGSPGPAELEAGIAAALRDPSARVLYWVPEFGAYADVEGRSADPEPGAGLSATPVTREGEPVALLLHDRALDDEPALLASVASAAGMLIQRAQLEVELRARAEELRGSRRRILEAEQRERRRLERDLHDGAQQRLLALSLSLGEIETRLDDDDLRHRVGAARAEVAASLAELRDLAHGIHPAALVDHGLAVALESLATRSTVPVEVTTTLEGRVSPTAEVTAFYLVCEALANVARHSRAGLVTVAVHADEGTMHVEVVDDGVGGADPAAGSGLRGLADRIEAVGGTFRVWSPPGGGTTIRAEIPCG